MSFFEMLIQHSTIWLSDQIYIVPCQFTADRMNLVILVPSTAACNSILRNVTLFKGDTFILDITTEVDSPLT